MKKITMICCAAILAACSSQIKVSRVSGNDKITNEYYYVLPKTVFAIDVPVKTTKYIIGSDFVKNLTVEEIKVYKEKYGLDEKIYKSLNAGNSGTVITKQECGDITFTTIARPDYNKVFKVEPNAKFLKEQAFTFTYTADGIASESEISIQDKTWDVTFKTLESVASIIGAVKSGKGPDKFVKDDLMVLDKLLASYFDFQSVGATGEINIYKEKVAYLEKQIAQSFGQHFYKTKTETKTIHVLFTPKSDLKGELKLFRFKETDGSIVLNNSYKEQLDALGLGKFAFGDFASGDKAFTLQLIEVNGGLGFNFNEYNNGSTGYVYNLPANYRIILKDEDGDAVVSQDVKIPQFGKMASLSSKQSKSKIQFNTETGELKSVTGENKAFSTETISAGTSALKSGVETIKGDDEYTRLDKEVKILELKKKKLDLQSSIPE